MVIYQIRALHLGGVIIPPFHPTQTFLATTPPRVHPGLAASSTLCLNGSNRNWTIPFPDILERRNLSWSCLGNILTLLGIEVGVDFHRWTETSTRGTLGVLVWARMSCTNPVNNFEMKIHCGWYEIRNLFCPPPSCYLEGIELFNFSKVHFLKLHVHFYKVKCFITTDNFELGVIKILGVRQNWFETCFFYSEWRNEICVFSGSRLSDWGN